MEEERDLELIEQYLNGELTAEVIQEIEDRLERDEAFRKHYDDTKELLEGIDFAARNETLSKLRSIEDTLPPFKEVKTVSFYQKPWVLGVAASISIIIFSAYFIFFQNQVTSNEELFNEHFEVYPNIIAPTVRGTVVNKKALKEEAYYNYDLGEYDTALKLFNQLSENEDEGAIHLYRGICFLMLNENENAIGSFRTYKYSSFQLFLPQINWYMGLAYLKLGQIKNAESVWKEIPEGNSYRSKIADLKASKSAL